MLFLLVGGAVFALFNAVTCRALASLYPALALGSRRIALGGFWRGLFAAVFIAQFLLPLNFRFELLPRAYNIFASALVGLGFLVFCVIVAFLGLRAGFGFVLARTRFGGCGDNGNGGGENGENGEIAANGNCAACAKIATQAARIMLAALLIGVSVYSFFNAFDVREKTLAIDVGLTKTARQMAANSNLPAAANANEKAAPENPTPAAPNSNLPASAAPAPLRIAVISDLHIGGFVTRTHIERIADKIAPHRPDALFVVGDLSDVPTPEMSAALAPLAALGLPTFAVLGNHEYYLDDLGERVAAIEALGWRVLKNEAVEFGGVDLVGLYDLAGRKKDRESGGTAKDLAGKSSENAKKSSENVAQKLVPTQNVGQSLAHNFTPAHAAQTQTISQIAPTQAAQTTAQGKTPQTAQAAANKNPAQKPTHEMSQRERNIANFSPDIDGAFASLAALRLKRCTGASGNFSTAADTAAIVNDFAATQTGANSAATTTAAHQPTTAANKPVASPATNARAQNAHASANANTRAHASASCGAEHPVILLAHQPKTARLLTAAQRAQTRLMISGHTHGGQIFPFGAIVKLANGYLYGLYNEAADPAVGDTGMKNAEGAASAGGAKSAFSVLVTSGAGFWGPPFRFLSRSEIVFLELY